MVRCYGKQFKRKDVSKGSVAVYVRRNMRRFVIPVSFLALLDFRVLMERAVEEYGFEQKGGLRLPEYGLRLLSMGSSKNVGCDYLVKKTIFKLFWFAVFRS
ncbi:hypothetical protein GIB67_009058 [Kingdonia uniflora]|uniref:Small auxin up regulated protein n=1 Tax=Kingdonia uniflora TaxID=39325 RepID=A0A7J7P886_9MAGN|nr:hypothetical protein GIB67_009058 [Kingdonia uniflora]